MKRMMIDMGVLFMGLCLAGLHTFLCYRLFGLAATLVIIGVQIILALCIVNIRIRAPV